MGTRTLNCFALCIIFLSECDVDLRAGIASDRATEVVCAMCVPTILTLSVSLSLSLSVSFSLS